MHRRNDYYAIYGKNWIVGRHLLPLLKAIGRNESGTVLDLACGDSPFRDCFPHAAEYLRMDRTGNDPEIVVGDFTQLPLGARSVDMVLVFQALTDTPDPRIVLREIRRVLRPNGIALIFESMCYPEHDLPCDYLRLMPNGLAAMAAEAGLTMSRCERLGGVGTRIAVLWNGFVVARFREQRFLRWPSHVVMGFSNALFATIDRLVPSSRLASDYLAILQLNIAGDASMGSSGST